MKGLASLKASLLFFTNITLMPLNFINGRSPGVIAFQWIVCLDLEWKKGDSKVLMEAVLAPTAVDKQMPPEKGKIVAGSHVTSHFKKWERSGSGGVKSRTLGTLLITSLTKNYNIFILRTNKNRRILRYVIEYNANGRLENLQTKQQELNHKVL
jgi:hypothetical protein